MIWDIIQVFIGLGVGCLILLVPLGALAGAIRYGWKAGGEDKK